MSAVKLDAILSGVAIVSPGEGEEPRIAFTFMGSHGKQIFAVPDSPNVFMAAIGAGHACTLTLADVTQQQAISLEFDDRYTKDSAILFDAQKVLTEWISGLSADVPDVVREAVASIDFRRSLRLPFAVSSEQ